MQANVTCERIQRGVRENGSWNGILGKINNRECDITFGGYYPDNEVHEDFWATDAYLEDPFVWYVKLATLEPPWLGLATIFAAETWILFFVVLVITWLTWYFIGRVSYYESDYHRSLSLTALNTWGLTICVSVLERPNHMALRILFISLTFYSLNAIYIYTSDLINVFSSPGYEHQIDNIEEVIELGIPFGGEEENRDWFIDEPVIYEKYNTSPNFEVKIKNIEKQRNIEFYRRTKNFDV